ncbi:uncharacterized protein [Henckelia pumila]|uniref:uncharacterized protein n=1 Tax=Henckelia pumila TaxID=405737 RepID=UPI003C6DC388
MVCDDPTLYESLVNWCRQADVSVNQAKLFQSSRPASSLGPRPQSFKKSSSSTSSSGSGGVMHFWKKGKCDHYGMNHPTDRFRKALRACFRCGEIGHLKNDCTQAGGAGGSGSCSQAIVQQRPSGQVFELNHDQEVEENESVTAGTFLLCGIPAFVLIDTGASHSFISAHFVKRHKLPYISLDIVLSILTPTIQSALAKRLVLGCPLEFEGNVLTANLMVLAMEDFNCILEIDMLNIYRAYVDCYQRLVQFHSVGGDSWFFYGEGARPPIPLVSFLIACRALESGREGYLICVVDLYTESVGIGCFTIVNEFPDVFPDEILGLPHVREVEFGIDMIPGTSPISRAPYRLAPSEMRELKNH